MAASSKLISALNTIADQRIVIDSLQARIIEIEAQLTAACMSTSPIVCKPSVSETYAQRKARLAEFYVAHFPGAKSVTGEQLRAAGWVQ